VRGIILQGFWAHLWRLRLRLVGIWAVVMVIAFIRIVTIHPVYTSSCLMLPLPLQQVEQGAEGGLGGGASVRSLLVGGGSSDAFAVAAFFESGQLLDTVIREMNLDRQMYPKAWDAKKDEWRGERPPAGKSRRALDRKIDVSYDGYTGLLELAVNWRSAKGAQEVASGLVVTADRMLRQAAIEEGERRIEELRREMSEASVSEISSYLAEETTRAISSLASIRARSGYAFRVIDPPLVPYRKSWPPRLLLLILTGLAVAAVEVLAVAGAYARDSAAREPGGAERPPSLGL
jgi:uncharacterized protein involved in exopolysaccharide biosynthesis